MKYLFSSAALLASSVLASPPPNTKIACDFVEMVDVVKDPKLYWGTWYAIGLANQEWDRTNMCTQIVLTGPEDNDAQKDVKYTGSYYRYNAKTVAPNVNYTRADGELKVQDMGTFNPPYRLSFPFLPPDFITDFRIVATDGNDDGEITAMITYTCVNNPPDSPYAPFQNNSQVFFLSRQPYFVPPVTYDRLAAKAAKAIGNFAKFKMEPVTHAPGWCDYKFNDFAGNYQSPYYPYAGNIQKSISEVKTTVQESCKSDSEAGDSEGEGGAITADLIFQIITLAFVVATFAIAFGISKSLKQRGSGSGNTETLLPGGQSTY